MKIDALMGQFDPRIADPLRRFFDDLRTVRVDVVMFMARKSFCLYDAFVAAGMAPIPDPIIVVSDRVLDVDLAPFNGKTILLVDDALILGSSVGEAKRRLEEAGATVLVYVFCRDKTHARDSVLTPDQVTVDVDAETAYYFATAALNALAVAGRPYVVDFPVSPPLELTPQSFSRVLEPPNWQAVDVSSRTQQEHGSASYVFLPHEDLRRSFEKLHRGLGGLLDLVKIRAYVTDVTSSRPRLTIVPIVTLMPTACADLQALFSALADALARTAERRGLIDDAAVRGELAHRLLQYALSASLALEFLRPLNLAGVEGIFPDREAGAHFGPWNAPDAAFVRGLTTSGRFLKLMDEAAPGALEKLAPAAVPDEPQQLADDFLPSVPDIFLREDGTDGAPPLGVEMATMAAGLAEVFYRMGSVKEPLAHEESGKFGEDYLSLPPEKVPHRDRLKKGIPWGALVDRFLGGVGLRGNRAAEAIFSVALDLCSDRGLAVPITFAADGIVLRGYRYGEPAVFREAEFALAYGMAQAFMKAAGREDIPRLTLTKLLALLVQVGVATKFLEPAVDGGPHTARVALELKGAVPKISLVSSRQPREVWLAEYLTKKGVFVEDLETRRYVLGTLPPAAASATSRAADAGQRARVLGSIAGKLLNTTGRVGIDAPPIGNHEFIAMTSVSRPRDAADALGTGLRYFLTWYDEDDGRGDLESALGKTGLEVNQVLERFTGSNGREGGFSIRMKYVDFRKDNVRKIIERCEQYLRDQGDEVAADTWVGYWRSYLDIDPVAEQGEFQNIIDDAASLGWDIGAALWLVEAGLSQKTRTSKGRPKSPVWGKYLKELDSLGELEALGLTPSQFVREARDVLAALGKRTDPTTADVVLRKGLDALDASFVAAEQLLDVIDVKVRDYGNVGWQRAFEWVLWYDVVESTGEGDRHLKDVASFQEFMARHLTSVRDDAFQRGIDIQPKDRDLESRDDDGKHVFVAGPGSLGTFHECIRTLQRALRAFKGVRVRAIVGACDIGGARVRSLYRGGPPRGEEFFEHFARLRDTVKSRANGLELTPDQSCIAVVGTAGRREPPVDIDGWVFQAKEEALTTIGGSSKAHVLWFGTLAEPGRR